MNTFSLLKHLHGRHCDEVLTDSVLWQHWMGPVSQSPAEVSVGPAAVTVTVLVGGGGAPHGVATARAENANRT